MKRLVIGSLTLLTIATLAVPAVHAAQINHPHSSRISAFHPGSGGAAGR